VQKQVLQHCTWKKICSFLQSELLISCRPGVLEASFKYGWMDSVKLINFGRTYTSANSPYAFLIAAASSSHVYASFANTGSRSRKWRKLFSAQKETGNKKKMFFNTSHPNNSNSAEQLVDVTVSMANR